LRRPSTSRSAAAEAASRPTTHFGSWRVTSSLPVALGVTTDWNQPALSSAMASTRFSGLPAPPRTPLTNVPTDGGCEVSSSAVAYASADFCTNRSGA
jgi:hypothetical protein